MYRYDEFDQHFVDERVAQFRDQTRRYIEGSLSHGDFLHLRLRNGLYIQRLAPMLRIAIPYGTLTSRQLRMLAHVARYYDKGYGHLSTRQNMQFNWPDLAEVPDILADLASVQMHSIQTSGNCIRNVTTDQFAGVAADESVDGRPYCELIRQWSTAHPEFDWLPRKFKIAVNGSASDRAAIDIHDIGIEARRDDQRNRFRHQGRRRSGPDSILASLIRQSLPDVHLLTYIEAILRVYNRYGRRDNKYKARIKILVRAMSPEVFRDQVDAEWANLKDGPTTLTREEIDRAIAAFTPPPYLALEPDPTLAARRLAEPEFSRWVATNVAPHKRPGYAIVTLSTKVTGVPPGDVTDIQMDAVADWADRFGFGEIRDRARTELRAARRTRVGAVYVVDAGARATTCVVESRQTDRHYLLPGWRLLLACQREVDSDCRSDSAAIRRHRLSVRSRRDQPEHLGMHERMRPPPRWPHRHSRRR